MILVDDIRDKETLEEWLKARPEASARRYAIYIAHRSAMRVLPLYMAELNQNWASDRDLKALPILRANLTSGVAGYSPTPEVASAAAASVSASASASVASASAYAAASAASAYASAASSAASASAAASAAVSVLWAALRADAQRIEAGDDPLTQPLWPDGMPDDIAAQWDQSQDWMAEHPGHDFWRRWYQAALAGRPLTGDWDSHWALLRDIALIPNTEWPDKAWIKEKKPDRASHIAALIAEIEEKYSYRVSDATRLTAERLLRSALARFGFNDTRGLMEMLPFASDLKVLKEPEALAAFLADADEAQWEIELFLKGIEREGRGLQGSGWGVDLL